MHQLYALIMAGGGGTRLWPESRAVRPKQFIDLFDRRSLLRIAFDRIRPLIPAERVLVVTGERYASEILGQLPELPPENLIAEPSGRNTAPCIGLGAIHLRRRDSAAVMAVLTADHVMHREEVLLQALKTASRAALGGRIVTLGITPDRPETGYGYIERDDQPDGQGLYPVLRFREKPDRATAEEYLRSGRYYWNSGMFVWRADVILDEMARLLPDLRAALAQMESALGTPREDSVVRRAWEPIHPISIDYGVMEGARNVAMLPVDPGWIDVGSWGAVYDESLAKAAEPPPEGNLVQRGEHLALDSQGCLVRSDKLVATVGVRDLLIIDTGDALLVCPRSQAQQVKTLVEMLRAQGRDTYL
jgi:mannose-1-phosphate guanylyltransferase